MVVNNFSVGTNFKPMRSVLEYNYSSSNDIACGKNEIV